jgi:cobalt-zinc-cadmium efflux system outer membrane protein
MRIVLLLYLLPIAACAETPLPSRLSLAAAERVFLADGIDLLIAEASADAAEGDLRSAGAHPNPGLGITPQFAPALNHGVLYSLGQNAPADLWGFGLSLSDNAAIEDQLSGKRSLRIEAAARASAAARLGIEEVKRVELSQLRQAYVAAVRARLNLAAAEESFETYDQQLQLNQKRYASGAINGLELSRVEQAQLESLQVLDQAKSGLTQAVASLMYLLGVREAPPTIELTSGIEAAPVPELDGATAASLNALALRNRTDLQIAQANFEQSRLMMQQAKRARVPDIAVSLSYSEQCRSSSCSSQPTFGLGLSGNLPVLYQQQGEIERAESSARAAERALDKARAQVLSDVTQAWAGYLAAKSQVERMNDGLLAQAKHSRDLAQLMYQKGAASLIDFMDAQRAYVASELEYHQDLANYWSAIFQLEQATGTTFHGPMS